MKFILQIIIIAIAATALEMFLPWWSIAIAAAAGGYFVKTKANFLAGFISVALLWIGYAYMLEANAAAPLAERVASIFSITKPLLILVTGILGGLVGGFAAMAGGSLKKEKRSYYH
jgi:hypothetical protein